MQSPQRTMSHKRAYSELSPSALSIPGQWPTPDSPGSCSYRAVDASDANDAHLGRAFLTTITSTISNIVTAPARLVQRLFSKQQVIVQPVVRKDGARKKRIIAVRPVPDELPTPTPPPRTRLLKRGRGRGNKTPGPLPLRAPLTEDVEMTDADLDFSFTNEWAKPIPPSSPGCINTSEEIGTPASPETSPDDTPLSIQASPTPVVASRVQDAAALSPNTQALQQLSPNTHFRIITNAAITPARRALLVSQALVKGAIRLPGAPPADHTIPSPSIEHAQGPTELQQKTYQADVLKNNAANIAFNAQQANEQYQAQTEARQNTNTDLPIVAESEPLIHVERVNEELSFLSDAPLNHVETVDEDLSFLPDAPDEEIPADNGESLIALFSPEPERKTTIRWKRRAHVKPFYCDDKIANMMDSTLESINFTPPKRASIALLEDSSEDNTQNGSEPSPSPLKEQGVAQESIAPVESRGFRGVPDYVWDDSSDDSSDAHDEALEESQISTELLEDLREDIDKKLALATPPLSESAVKVLVTPLSTEEQDKLKAAAASTDDGKNRTKWLIDQKLNAHDFSTLLPRQFSGDPRAWLNDNIVNEYLGLLMAKVKKDAGFEHKRGGPAPPMHAFSSFWYTTLKKRPKDIVRWAPRFHLGKEQYLDADLILYPICEIGHWRLLVVKPKDRTIEYLDSMNCDGTVYINDLKGYLATEIGAAWVEDEWTVLNPKNQRSVQQINNKDCGVFTVLNALALVRGEDLTKVLASNGMFDARERIAISLLAGAPTTEFD
jgi:hypothetical protein